MGRYDRVFGKCANYVPEMWVRSWLIKKGGSFYITDLPCRYTKVEGNLFWAIEDMATKLRPLGEEFVLIAKRDESESDIQVDPAKI